MKKYLAGLMIGLFSLGLVATANAISVYFTVTDFTLGWYADHYGATPPTLDFSAINGSFTYHLTGTDFMLDTFSMTIGSKDYTVVDVDVYQSSPYSVTLGGHDAGGASSMNSWGVDDFRLGFAPVGGYVTPSFAFSLISQDARWESVTASSSATQTPVPEPGTLILLGAGFAGLFVSRLRAKKK